MLRLQKCKRTKRVEKNARAILRPPLPPLPVAPSLSDAFPTHHQHYCRCGPTAFARNNVSPTLLRPLIHLSPLPTLPSDLFSSSPTVSVLRPTCSWVEMSGWAGTVSHFLFPVRVRVRVRGRVCALWLHPSPPPSPTHTPPASMCGAARRPTGSGAVLFVSSPRLAATPAHFMLPEGG